MVAFSSQISIDCHYELGELPSSKISRLTKLSGGNIWVHMGSYGIRDGTMQSAIRQKLPDLAKNGKDMAAIHFIIFGHKLS